MIILNIRTMKNKKNEISKSIFLLTLFAFISCSTIGQPIITKTIPEDVTEQNLEEMIRKYMYDTLVGKVYPAFKEYDLKGNLIVREENNDKPAFIYTFTTNCKACHTDLTTILPILFEEFKDKIDFFFLTPATVEALEKDFKEKSIIIDIPIIILPRNYFETGFPMGYLLDKQNNVLLKRIGGGGGTYSKMALTIHYEILRKWFLQALSEE